MSGWLGRLLLATGSLCAVWALLEFAALPLFVRNAPLERQARFTREMQVLAQDTKRGLVPRDYVLLLGDSHAKGLGDWLIAADLSGHPPYHSAHVIHERLGRDVLSFGEPNASSVDALVRQPRNYTSALSRFGLEPPRQIVFYFYEGNDLRDNLRELREMVGRGADAGRLGDPAYLERRLREQVARDAVWWKRLQRQLLLGRYVERLVEALVDRARGIPSRQDPRSPAEPGRVTRARVGGSLHGLPDGLQSPGLELDDEEWQLGVTVLDVSLGLFREFYPRTSTLVVYLPSPLSCYEVTSEEVSVQTASRRSKVYPTARLVARGDALAGRVAELSRRWGLQFLDLRPALRRAASEHWIHGPRDWAHFNERGYRVIGREVAAALAAPGRGEEVPLP